MKSKAAATGGEGVIFASKNQSAEAPCQRDFTQKIGHRRETSGARSAIARPRSCRTQHRHGWAGQWEDPWRAARKIAIARQEGGRLSSSIDGLQGSDRRRVTTTSPKEASTWCASRARPPRRRATGLLSSWSTPPPPDWRPPGKPARAPAVARVRVAGGGKRAGWTWCENETRILSPSNLRTGP